MECKIIKLTKICNAITIKVLGWKVESKALRWSHWKNQIPVPFGARPGAELWVQPHILSLHLCDLICWDQQKFSVFSELCSSADQAFKHVTVWDLLTNCRSVWTRCLSLTHRNGRIALVEQIYLDVIHEGYGCNVILLKNMKDLCVFAFSLTELEWETLQSQGRLFKQCWRNALLPEMRQICAPSV